MQMEHSNVKAVGIGLMFSAGISMVSCKGKDQTKDAAADTPQLLQLLRSNPHLLKYHPMIG